jgi:hypothetical protein
MACTNGRAMGWREFPINRKINEVACRTFSKGLLAMSSLDFSLIGKGGLKDHLGLIFLELFASSRSEAEILTALSVAKSGKNSGKIKLVAFFSEAWTKRKNYNF